MENKMVLNSKITQEQQDQFIDDLKNHIKELSGNNHLYIMQSNVDELIGKIGKDIFEGTNLIISYSHRESGMIDISEYISNFISDIEHVGKPEYCFDFKRFKNSGSRFGNNQDFITDGFGGCVEKKLELNQEELAKIAEYDSKLIPSSGTADTEIGEIFRALQYIEYRAGNDGDIYYAIGTPNFLSYLYILSKIDNINWGELYDTKVELNNPKLNNWIHDNKICWDGMIIEIPYIKLILIDLMEQGIIQNGENCMDSRSFTDIEKQNEYGW